MTARLVVGQNPDHPAKDVEDPDRHPTARTRNFETDDRLFAQVLGSGACVTAAQLFSS
jgi:hypothetical protein